MGDNVKKLEGNKVEILVEVSPEDFNEALQKAYFKTKKKYNVPKFRPGKAPQKVIEAYYGEGVFYEEAFETIFPDVYGKVIDENGLDTWQCAVYYNGANGTKNPFMPPDAYAEFENRLEIIAGEAQVTPETARKILDRIYFYPPAQHAYQCSICGRACDMACYSHLEQKGVLSKKFNKPFKRRKDWEFDISDFE